MAAKVGSVSYSDEEIEGLSTDQFSEYMSGGDPLGKKKKQPSLVPLPSSSPAPPEGMLRKRIRQANEAAGD